MRVVFFGANARIFHEGFAEACAIPLEITLLDDDDRGSDARRALAAADAVIGVHWQDASLEVPRLRLFHVAAAGLDSVRLDLLPPAAAVCNCHGHEPAIAEYVMLAALRHVHPVEAADRFLRRGTWRWCAQSAGEMREELGGRTIGILGFGRIGQAVAARAKAFDLRVIAANRSPIAPNPTVDVALPLAEAGRLYDESDVVVCALPLAQETLSFVDAAAFGRMRPEAMLINVGRGPVVDETALYEALRSRRIAAAAIDTWYVYPSPENAGPLPSRLPFHELDNILMTPHLSGWTHGTRRRRRATMAANLERLARGEPLVNLVRPAVG